jgi:hypothetical protein
MSLRCGGSWHAFRDRSSIVISGLVALPVRAAGVRAHATGRLPRRAPGLSGARAPAGDYTSLSPPVQVSKAGHVSVVGVGTLLPVAASTVSTLPTFSPGW